MVVSYPIAWPDVLLDMSGEHAFAIVYGPNNNNKVQAGQRATRSSARVGRGAWLVQLLSTVHPQQEILYDIYL